MSPEWRAAFLAHAQSPEYARRIAEANRTIRDALADRLEMELNEYLRSNEG